MSRLRRSRAPLIGITADVFGLSADGRGRDAETTFSLPQRYCRAVEDCGGLPVLVAPTTETAAAHRLFARLDGLLVSGGNFDIHPKFYGETPVPGLGEIKASRTEFELDLIHWALRRDLPLLAICGGLQALNVALGGSLFQNIEAQLPNAAIHQRSAKNPAPAHCVRVHPQTLLHRIVKQQCLTVNTRHHQAVKRPGKGLVVNATADDGLIEGIESPRHSFALGVQWHPEALSGRDAFQRRIFASFVSTCRDLHRGS